MFLRQTTKPKGIYLAIVENVYDSSTKKSRQRTIEGIGYLEDLKKQYEDPIAYFSQKAADMTAEKKAGAATAFSISKKDTYESKGIYFENFDGFSLDDVYHALDIISDNRDALQKWIFEHSGRICERDLSVSYFDCTNYYFDIGRSDMDILDDDGNPVDKNGVSTEAKYRKRGPEKNHRPDPIVEMGLLMDKNGIPLAFDLFAGNESEKVHMRPILNRVKKEFSNTRTIIVADRGLNTSDNIYFINGDNKGENNQRDGYVYGQSVRGQMLNLKSGYWAAAIQSQSSGMMTDRKSLLPTNPASTQRNFM